MPHCNAGTSLDMDGCVSPHPVPLQMLLPWLGGSSVPVLQSMKMREALEKPVEDFFFQFINNIITTSLFLIIKKGLIIEGLP